MDKNTIGDRGDITIFTSLILFEKASFAKSVDIAIQHNKKWASRNNKTDPNPNSEVNIVSNAHSANKGHHWQQNKKHNNNENEISRHQFFNPF